MRLNLKDKACSKDWWYEFVNRHADIYKLWNQLPLKNHRKVDDDEEDNHQSSYNQSVLTADTDDISVFMENVTKDFAALATNCATTKNLNISVITNVINPIIPEENENDFIGNMSEIHNNTSLLFGGNEEEFLEDLDAGNGFVFLPDITVDLVRELYQE